MKTFLSLLTRRNVYLAVNFAVLLSAAVLAMVPTKSAAQQNLFEPVARVNDRVVTAYELSQRIAFMTLLRAPGDLRATSLERLIEERLQQDAARLTGVSLTEEQLVTGMEEFAGRANMDVETFIKAIAQGGVAAESFRDFVAAGMLWRETVRKRFVARVQITEAEIDRAIALTQPGAGVRVLLSEIILPADTPAAKQAADARAEQLSKITTLPAFAAAARRYSASPSKGRSGRLEWMDLSNLPPQLAAAVLPLAPGEVSGPLPVNNGVALFQMRAIEETDIQEAQDVSIEYAAFFLPGGAAARPEAMRLQSQLDTCDDLYGVAHDLPEGRLLREVLPVADLPADYAVELAQLDDGEVSTNLTTANGETLVFLMLCGRTRALPEDVSREDVVAQLRNKRLVALAGSYLEELRADAHIEILTE